MRPEIRESPFEKRLFGRTKPVLENQRPVEAMFAAMDETWAIVREHSISNEGMNHVVYTGGQQVFAGVQIEGSWEPSWGLEQVDLVLPRYLYYRHVGTYDLLGEAYSQIDEAIDAKGLERTGLSLEIYGHWDDNPAKLVTEILIGIH
jgi:effector-binding domain-containing protein